MCMELHLSFSLHWSCTQRNINRAEPFVTGLIGSISFKRCNRIVGCFSIAIGTHSDMVKTCFQLS